MGAKASHRFCSRISDGSLEPRICLTKPGDKITKKQVRPQKFTYFTKQGINFNRSNLSKN